MLKYPVILGKKWMIHNIAFLIPHLKVVGHEKAGIEIPNFGDKSLPLYLREIKTATLVDAKEFIRTVGNISGRKKDLDSFICKAIINDIDKILQKLLNQNSRSLDELKSMILSEFHDLLFLWVAKEAAKLQPNRLGVDHQIEIKNNSQGKELQILVGPIYDMPREELLVLRKTLNNMLDKGYIRASKSETTAPVLFARKPSGGLRFCCDYRGLNAITKTDRYPVPLIKNTIRNLTKARWFTKLNVVAAFHKIINQPGEE